MERVCYEVLDKGGKTLGYVRGNDYGAVKSEAHERYGANIELILMYIEE